MKWNYATRPNGERETYGLISECGQYRIAKAIVRGEAVYSLYNGTEWIGRYASANDAKKEAQSLDRA